MDVADRTATFARLQRLVEEHGYTTSSMSPNYNIYDADLHVGENTWRNLVQYYSLCKDSDALVATLSCYSEWVKYKKVNSHAKVIPAVPMSMPDERVRVFFFDDNMDLCRNECRADSQGICNLRDISTGSVVDFSDGANGFVAARAGRHTVVYHSSEYRNVLVQANVLDAMEDEDYFTNIMARFKAPDDQIMAFMDVNSTIVCADTVTGKDSSQILLATMFELIEVTPKSSFEFTWDDEKAVQVKVAKAMSLKAIVKKVTDGDKKRYQQFYDIEQCSKLFALLISLGGEIRWTSHNEELTLASFTELYENYLKAMACNVTEDGITNSWFKAYNVLKERPNSIIMNSFGVDTRKVLKKTLRDERDALQITVNFDLWLEGDRKNFEQSYGLVSDPVLKTGSKSSKDIAEDKGNAGKDGQKKPKD